MVLLMGLFQSCVSWKQDDPDHLRKRHHSRTQTSGSDVEKGKGSRIDTNDTTQTQEDSEEQQQMEQDANPQGRRAVFKQIFLSRGQAHNFAKYCPLIAAILAPFATLMDIPALSERWYYLDGVQQPDPKASLVLSGVGLGLNIIANGLLILRFSSTTPFWIRVSTPLSLVGWLGKTVVALVNLILFGILAGNGGGYQFSEAFWCAVVSVIVSGIISLCLLNHFFLVYGDKDEDGREVRAEGRKFMLSVTAFLFIMGIQALVFCKIEGWSYSNAIYFSVQTALTIGYGDFAPTTTAGKVLIFPFSVLTISQLGNEVALIIAFISARANERRDKWRRRYEGAIHREANSLRPKAGLLEEMALIHQINTREEIMNQVYDLLWSAVSLVIFWLVGAVIFSEIEGWTYGNAVYAVMILSLTIGFGDFTPETDAGRVVFIVYALMAVPIVTSFAVQTITGLLSTVSQHGDSRDRFRKARTSTPGAFNSHTDFILRAHETYDHMRERLFADISGPKGIENHKQGNEIDREDTEDQDTTQLVEELEEENRQQNGDPDQNEAERHIREDYTKVLEVVKRRRHERQERTARSHEAASDRETDGDDTESANGATGSDQDADERSQLQRDEEDKAAGQLALDLTSELMHRVVQLEAEARQMLLENMGKGIARTLLLADRNVQMRDVRALHGSGKGTQKNILADWRGQVGKTQHASDEADHDNSLERVRRYRNTFAEVLVLGSILQKLEGEEAAKFERWREESHVEAAQKAQEEHEDLEKVAETTFGGLEGRLFRLHAKKLRTMDWDKMLEGWDDERAKSIKKLAKSGKK